jgi:hypothetical protein
VTPARSTAFKVVARGFAHERSTYVVPSTVTLMCPESELNVTSTVTCIHFPSPGKLCRNVTSKCAEPSASNTRCVQLTSGAWNANPPAKVSSTANPRAVA